MNTINPRNSRFSSTFAFTCALFLSLTLALTWLLSLRAVRLEIGDYYLEQGNFDQTVNRYKNQKTQITLLRE